MARGNHFWEDKFKKFVGEQRWDTLVQAMKKAMDEVEAEQSKRDETKTLSPNREKKSAQINAAQQKGDFVQKKSNLSSTFEQRQKERQGRKHWSGAEPSSTQTRSRRVREQLDFNRRGALSDGDNENLPREGEAEFEALVFGEPNSGSSESGANGSDVGHPSVPEESHRVRIPQVGRQSLRDAVIWSEILKKHPDAF